MIFSYPWLLALLPLPVLTRFLFPVHESHRAAIRVPQFDLIEHAVGGSSMKSGSVRKRSWFQWCVFATCWTLVVVAMARPQVFEPPITKQIPTRDLLLAIDLSGSMETKDFFDATGKKIDRLEAVKEVLGEFLAQRAGDRVGMIVFGTGAFIQIPFTQDLKVCQELLNQTEVRMAGPQTSFGDAIGLAINVFERSSLDDKVLIALTDGNDTGSRVPPIEAAKIAADQGIVIHTVGVGDPEAAGEELLDEQVLREVSERTGGRYFFAADRDQLNAIYDQLDELSVREIESVSYRPKRDLFHWFIAVAFMISTAVFLAKSIFLAWKSTAIRRLAPPGVASTEGRAA